MHHVAVKGNKWDTESVHIVSESEHYFTKKGKILGTICVLTTGPPGLFSADHLGVHLVNG